MSEAPDHHGRAPGLISSSISVTSAVNGQTVLNRCNAGETGFCSQLDFNGPGGVLSQIRIIPRNLSSVKTSGFDFQLDYGMDVGEGRLATRLVSNYILNQSQVALGVKTRYDGALGGDSPVSGVPKLRVTLTETYSQGPFSATVQARMIGKAKLVRAWTALDVDDNSVPAKLYTDLRGSWQVTEKAQIYGAIDNLFNIDPPNIAVSQNNTASLFSTAVRGDIYDTIGRSYRVGIRMNF